MDLNLKFHPIRFSPPEVTFVTSKSSAYYYTILIYTVITPLFKDNIIDALSSRQTYSSLFRYFNRMEEKYNK